MLDIRTAACYYVFMTAKEKFPMPAPANRRQHGRAKGKFNETLDVTFSILRKVEGMPPKKEKS
jgi:hypothetical protein